jgi:molecular chaperone GrpE (heat shock protein)
MNRKLFISSILLIAAGAGVLCGIWLYRYVSTKQAEEYRATCTGRTAEYLEIYDKWRNLAHDDSADSSDAVPPQLPEQTPAEQSERLRAYLPEIARNGLKEPLMIAEMLYGPKWAGKVRNYKSLQEILDVISSAGMITVMLGVIVMSSCYLKLCAVFIAGKCRRTPTEDDYAEPPEDTGKTVSLVDSGEDTANTADNAEIVDKEPEKADNEHEEEKLDYYHTISNQKNLLTADDVHNAVSPAARLVPEKKAEQLAQLYTTEPVKPDNGLSELTQEVTAIRQFASKQQDRVQQLQDGYDWTIIKRFCMRIIRCIDNLDGRIKNLSKSGADVSYLLDVRDELVFAIESSGVEQIPIQPGSVYTGNEKIAEAIADKQATDDPELTGKVAAVIRPGYQYVINDQQVRVVRTAQVVLYE